MFPTFFITPLHRGGLCPQLGLYCLWTQIPVGICSKTRSLETAEFIECVILGFEPVTSSVVNEARYHCANHAYG